MKEEVVIYTIVIQARYIYIIHDVVLVIPYNKYIRSSRKYNHVIF